MMYIFTAAQKGVYNFLLGRTVNIEIKAAHDSIEVPTLTYVSETWT